MNVKNKIIFIEYLVLATLNTFNSHKNAKQLSTILMTVSEMRKLKDRGVI